MCVVCIVHRYCKFVFFFRVTKTGFCGFVLNQLTFNFVKMVTKFYADVAKILQIYRWGILMCATMYR